MRYRGLYTTLLCIALLFLMASFSSADPILEYDVEGNLNLADNDSVFPEEIFAGSSTEELAASSDGEFAGSDSGELSISGTGEATEYLTESGYPYSLYQAQTPYAISRMCIILIPERMDPDQFMNDTEWTLFSGMNGFDIVLLSYDWNSEEAAAYYDSVYKELQETAEEDIQFYLVGYEEGGDFAALEAASHTTRYSGLVTLGGSGIPKKQLEELKKKKNRDALHVWIIAPEKSSEITENLSYWRSVNSITGSNSRPYQLRFAEELYLPATSSIGGIDSHTNRMGIVLYSRESEYYDFAVSGRIAANFISQTEKDRISFRQGVTGGELIAIRDAHFTYNRLQTEGQQRDYWIYAPNAAYLSIEPSTLIFCLHGNYGTGEGMIFQTHWHETADKNNCIVVYPSSLYKSGSQHYWEIVPEETQFFRTLVETICSRFRVDRSRIYLTGFSNGCAMCQNLAIRCSDIFAASVDCAPAYYEKETYGPIDTPLHEVAALYTYGTEDEFLDAYEMDAEINGLPATRKMQIWEMIYGFDHDSYECNEIDPYTVYTYRSPNRIPVCHWIKVRGRRHTYPAEEVPFYFEFMKHYTKSPEGDLYYDDRKVESNLTHGATWDEYYGVDYELIYLN